MSTESTTGYTANTGEWWWLAGYLLNTALEQAHWRSQRGGFSEIQWQQEAITGGVKFQGLLDGEQVLFVQVTATKTQTFISVSEQFPFEGFWPSIVHSCLAMERQARELHRTVLTQRYEALLFDYYEQRSQLKAPNLRQMAEEYGVNYGSVRQYKIGYDKRLKESMLSE